MPSPDRDDRHVRTFFIVIIALACIGYGAIQIWMAMEMLGG